MLGLAMVTDTPGRTPPEESVTFPLIDPVVALTCAKAGAAATATNRPKANATILFIAPPNLTVKCKTKIPTPPQGPTDRLSRRCETKRNEGGPVDAHSRALGPMPQG